MDTVPYASCKHEAYYSPIRLQSFVTQVNIILFSQSTFGYEFIVLSTAHYLVLSICYKFIIMAALVDGESNVFSDNEEVRKSSSRKEATINKKHVYI